MYNRCFQELGLQEGASASEIERTYNMRVKKYHDSDYDDDPEYVRIKLNNLKRAYEEALSVTTADGYDAEYEASPRDAVNDRIYEREERDDSDTNITTKVKNRVINSGELIKTFTGTKTK